MQNILITGGAGFIGSHLVESLIEKNKVYILDDLSTGCFSNLNRMKNHRNFYFVKGSVLNLKKLASLVKKADLIFHLAAGVGVKNILNNPLKTIRTNLQGTKNIIQLALPKKKKIVFASTSEVYGKSLQIPFDEEQSDRVLGPVQKLRWSYAQAKAMDESLLLAYYKQYNLPVVIIRFFNIVGSRQSSQYGMVLPSFIKQAQKNKLITVYGTGKQKRCFCDVGEAVEAIILLSQNKQALGEIINLGNNKLISINALAKKVKKILKSNSKITHLPYKKVYGNDFDEIMVRQPDLKKIEKIINWKPKISIQTIIKTIIKSI